MGTTRFANSSLTAGKMEQRLGSWLKSWKRLSMLLIAALAGRGAEPPGERCSANCVLLVFMS